MSRHRDRPYRLGATDAPRILSREECDAIAERVFRFARGRGSDTRVGIFSWWQGEMRWGRNRVSLASDRRDLRIEIWRGSPFGSYGSATTNQVDDVSLEAAVRAAERELDLMEEDPPAAYLPPLPTLDVPKTAIWSDATVGLTTEARGEMARALVDSAEGKGMLSAGYAEVRAAAKAVISSEIRAGRPAMFETPYSAWTHAQCSMTVRDATGTGSGWAGLSSYDWGKIDAPALAERALDKCLRSRNPVGLEPGRYTVILEPQAVADLIEPLVYWLGARERAESGNGPFVLGSDDALHITRTKLGLKVVDERITISHDYADPALGIVPEVGAGSAPVSWIDHGVLSALSYSREYGLGMLGEQYGLRGTTGYRMSGGESSIAEMIRTTKRGLLVTRLWNVGQFDESSVLCTGLTRDGLWLIENGKITKPVKNFRFTESPLFVLNSIEALGTPVPVFRPTRSGSGELMPAIVPPLKARDFSFTSLVDAV
ncbi:MAG TPA: metallopeptidase TldD-related protein [Gemmatimonadaceae bacterium]|nr:metallopeptidase TldD-related protein [Gemmatimonadaceae bacterium]